MRALHPCTLVTSGLLALLLPACGGGGSGSNVSSTPALTDNGGLWAGTWVGTTGPGAGLKGTVVTELHQTGASLTGYAHVTNGSLPGGLLACSGAVNGTQLQFGIFGQVTYSGTLAGTTVAGTFTDTISGTGGTWRIYRLMQPFDDLSSLNPPLTGIWNFTPTSTKGANPTTGALTLTQTGQELTGTATQGTNMFQVNAGRTAGTKAWFAAENSDGDVLMVGGGDLAAGNTSASGAYATYDVSVPSNLTDQGTWMATKQ
jgi:hypothetical protein